MSQVSDQERDPLISIIIVTWNCRDYALRCLETVFKSNQVSFEVIVRDNGSEDGTWQAVQEEYPQVKLLGDARNIGFAAANNEAIKGATGRYFLLLNPDTEIPPDALVRFVNIAKAHSERVIVVPTLLNSDGTIQRSLHSFPTLAGVARKSIAALKGLLRVRTDNRDLSIDWARGACLFVPVVVHQTVGELDGNLFMYGEDLDYCWRAHRAGFDIIWASQVQIIHYGNISGAQKWGDQRFIRTNQTLIYFWMKHFGLYCTVVLMLTRMVYLLVRIVGDLGQEVILWAKGSRSPKYPERLLSGVAFAQACFDRSAWPFYLSARRKN
jgi:GT2 family glycosyltransferase